jgi:hypothetical protein
MEVANPYYTTETLAEVGRAKLVRETYANGELFYAINTDAWGDDQTPCFSTTDDLRRFLTEALASITGG